MVITSIILYHHSLEKIIPLLDSLVQTKVRKVYIIDQSEDVKTCIESDIQTYLQSKHHAFEWQYVKLPNKGYGCGHNHAMRFAISEGAEYHVVMNPDIAFEGDIITKMEAYMDTHENVAQMMPMVRYPNGDIQYLCKQLPTPMDLLGRLLLPKRWTQKRTERFEMRDTGYDHIMNVPYLSGCFMIFRLTAIKEIGFFDERFFMYAEDIDITRRLHEHYKTLFFPEVEITHIHNQGDRRSLRLMWIHIVNIIRYFNKWGWRG